MRRFLQGLILGVFAGPVAALATAWYGMWPMGATEDPPAWESRIAGRLLDASVARRAPHAANPVKGSSDQLAAGMKIYRDACAGCHGDARGPSRWGTKCFYPRAPQFAQELPDQPDWQMFWIVKHGIRYTGMAAWDKEMPDEKIWQVVTFLTRIGSLPADVKAAWEKR